MSRGAIDIHTHIFNGRDVPVVGFLEQVVLRDPHRPDPPDFLTGGLLKLLKFVLLSGTPTAEEELRRLDAEPTALRAPRDMAAEDEGNVAAAIARFEAELGRPTAGFTSTQSEEEKVLAQLYDETGLDREQLALIEPGAAAARLAAAIYERTREDESYVRVSPFVQTIRWAGLLTRARMDILTELVTLYGGEGGFQVFSPSVVDFELWFRTDEDVTPVNQQVELMSRIAKSREDVVFLNFGPFCPLRAALELERDQAIDPLRHVKRAVETLGFAGVKLYPPLGFRPLGNEETTFELAKRAPEGGGSALDGPLRMLYGWCESNDVPIKAHANNSIEAATCSGLKASPANWGPVFDEFPSLRVNLAHFGGFDETGGLAALLALSQGCADPDGRDWEAIIHDMIAEHDNLYFDLGYWTEVVGPETPERERVLGAARDLFETRPEMLNRVMYGSDWSMIGREPSHPEYFAGVRDALDDLGLDAAQVVAVEGGNARRYLGLDRAGLQLGRLSEFFGEEHLFSELFATPPS